MNETTMQPAVRLEELKAVIFDMDGVIINGMPYHARAWQETFQRAGLTITAEEVYEREGEAGVAAVGHFLKERGIDASVEDIKAMIREKEALYKTIAKVEVFDGVRDFLAELQRRGKRLALVTGTARQELEISLPEDIQKRFEVMVTGDSVTRGKPDPEPYQKSLAVLGIAPHEAVVIENAPLGIRSALAAGMRCLAVETSLGRDRLSGAERCFSNIADLAHYLLST